MTTKNIKEFFEEKARKGEGAFSIAYALLELADAQKKSARALDKLGFNDDRPTGPPGTTEALVMQATRIADALSDRSN